MDSENPLMTLPRLSIGLENGTSMEEFILRGCAVWGEEHVCMCVHSRATMVPSLLHCTDVFGE